jgi:hypothetical protein
MTPLVQFTVGAQHFCAPNTEVSTSSGTIILSEAIEDSGSAGKDLNLTCEAL